MGGKLKKPQLHTLLLMLMLSIFQTTFQSAKAEVILMPIHRTIPTQPITKLEVVGMVKSILSGRVLSIKKQPTSANPDCHHIKFLEDRGEFHIIEVGCFINNIVTMPHQ